jgi:hypothetical protein
MSAHHLHRLSIELENAIPERSSEQAEAAYVQACDAAGVLGRLAL